MDRIFINRRIYLISICCFNFGNAELMMKLVLLIFKQKIFGKFTNKMHFSVFDLSNSAFPKFNIQG
jgi:hypothetical protein